MTSIPRCPPCSRSPVELLRPGTVTVLVTGGGNGANTADLVLGTAAANTNLRGMNGDDCILGGGGNDMLRGDGGTDVSIGGPGTDTLHATCETQIQ